jgi:SAM-dependent methyltransferase
MESEFPRGNKDLIFGTIIDGLLKRTAPGARSLLDIGAHLGRFVHLAALRGFAAEGVELNVRAAAFAARTTGRAVHPMSARDLVAQGRRYDAVTLIDVLEHIPEPVSVLETVRSVLKPGGWVAIKVPHGHAQWFKEHLRAWLRPGYRPCIADNLLHVNQFGVRSLTLALNNTGFSDVSVEIAAPELVTMDVPFVRRKPVNATRLGVWHLARRLPGAVHSPLGLHLQAYARRA